MNARASCLAALAALLLSAAPRAGLAAPQTPAPVRHGAWRPDPLAAGRLAVRPDDHVVTGRVASVTGDAVIIASDFGGTETLRLPPGVAARPRSGELVTASYHVEGPALQIDLIVPGDLSAASTPVPEPTGTGTAR